MTLTDNDEGNLQSELDMLSLLEIDSFKIPLRSN